MYMLAPGSEPIARLQAEAQSRNQQLSASVGQYAQLAALRKQLQFEREKLAQNSADQQYAIDAHSNDLSGSLNAEAARQAAAQAAHRGEFDAGQAQQGQQFGAKLGQDDTHFNTENDRLTNNQNAVNANQTALREIERQRANQSGQLTDVQVAAAKQKMFNDAHNPETIMANRFGSRMLGAPANSGSGLDTSPPGAQGQSGYGSSPDSNSTSSPSYADAISKALANPASAQPAGVGDIFGLATPQTLPKLDTSTLFPAESGDSGYAAPGTLLKQAMPVDGSALAPENTLSQPTYARGQASGYSTAPNTDPNSGETSFADHLSKALTNPQPTPAAGIGDIFGLANSKAAAGAQGPSATPAYDPDMEMYLASKGMPTMADRAFQRQKMQSDEAQRQREITRQNTRESLADTGQYNATQLRDFHQKAFVDASEKAKLFMEQKHYDAQTAASTAAKQANAVYAGYTGFQPINPSELGDTVNLPPDLTPPGLDAIAQKQNYSDASALLQHFLTDRAQKVNSDIPRTTRADAAASQYTWQNVLGLGAPAGIKYAQAAYNSMFPPEVVKETPSDLHSKIEQFRKLQQLFPTLEQDFSKRANISPAQAHAIIQNYTQ